MNLLGIKKSDSPLSELCFNNNDFNFINDYFLTTKDPKDKLLNTIEYPLLLSKHLLVKYKNKDKDNDKEKEKDEYLLPFTYQLIILNIINLSLNSENLFEFKKEKKDYDELMNNIDNIYKQVIETLLELIKLNKDFREDGYNKFYKKWKIYNKKFDDKNTIEFIKDEIMIKTFLLLPSEYEKSKDEEYPLELSRKQINLKDNYFGNCLLIFMMLHDLRELLLNNESSNKGNSSLKLIKDDFPLLIKSNEVSDFEMDKEYNLDKINTTKLYRKAVSYKNNKSENFVQGELVIYNKHLYFCTVIKENNVKINLKFILKSIGLFKEKGDKNFEINLLIQKSQNIEEDSALAKIFDNDDNNEGLYTIVIQFENEDAKKEAAQIITDKILSANNDERLVFDGYFKEINNSIKHLEEDF
jgi:hypothetical protein